MQDDTANMRADRPICQEENPPQYAEAHWERVGQLVREALMWVTPRKPIVGLKLLNSSADLKINNGLVVIHLNRR